MNERERERERERENRFSYKHHQRCESRIRRRPCRCCSLGMLDRMFRHTRCWSMTESAHGCSSIRCLGKSRCSGLARCIRSRFEWQCKAERTSEEGSSWPCKRRTGSRPTRQSLGGTRTSSMPPFLDTIGTLDLGLRTRERSQHKRERERERERERIINIINQVSCSRSMLEV